MSAVYVVERHYDYEGSVVVWVGASFDEAMSQANASEYGDETSVSKWENGELREEWSRYRSEREYSHKALGPDGRWRQAP